MKRLDGAQRSCAAIELGESQIFDLRQPPVSLLAAQHGARAFEKRTREDALAAVIRRLSRDRDRPADLQKAQVCASPLCASGDGAQRSCAISIAIELGKSQIFDLCQPPQ